MKSARTILIVPCYNEEKRIDAREFFSLLADDTIELLFVNDGSTDGTLDRLHELAAQRPDRVDVLSLEPNRGKAEAVREGLSTALTRQPTFVGYVDADLATPVSEIRRLVRVMRESDADGILGSRIALMGRDIERTPRRHYLGRAFATAASLVLQTEVYDTQCGAKLFRCTPALRAAVAEPFISRWAFDVELLGRLLVGTATTPGVARSAIREEPLLMWHDVAGSTLGPAQMARTLADLVRIKFDLARRRTRTSA